MFNKIKLYLTISVCVLLAFIGFYYPDLPFIEKPAETNNVFLHKAVVQKEQVGDILNSTLVDVELSTTERFTFKTSSYTEGLPEVLTTHNGEIIDDNDYLYHPNIAGLCFDEHAEEVAVMYYGYINGYGYSSTQMMHFSNAKRVSELTDETDLVEWLHYKLAYEVDAYEQNEPDVEWPESDLQQLFHCKEGQVSHFSELVPGSENSLCQCNTETLYPDLDIVDKLNTFIPTESDYFTQNWQEHFFEGEPQTLSLLALAKPAIEFDDFISYLQSHEFTSITVEHVKSGAYQLLNIVNVVRPLYQRGGWLFLKTPQGWHLLQHVGDSSKGVNPAIDLTATSSGFELMMCVEDCHWYGDVVSVEIDINDMSIKLLGDYDLY